MIELQAPPTVDGDSLRDELEANGIDRDTDFFITGDQMVFLLPESFRDRLVAVLQGHKPSPKPPKPSPAEARIASLEAWAAATDDAMNQLILDALFASLSDEDLLADLGGL